jgi:inward rectifier potassium channel
VAFPRRAADAGGVATKDEKAAAARQDDTGIDVVNAPSETFTDLYHRMLRASWKATLLGISAAVLLANFVFGVGYYISGGVAGARPGSFADAFFFSVQTFGTIGYGAFYPKSLGAHLLVTAESIVSLLIAAISTGLIFAKFSIPRARIAFSRLAVISPLNGVPSLAFRVGNMRGNYVVDATFRLTLTRLERTAEGRAFYRMRDLRLLRERSPSLGRTWTIVHPLDEQSPMRGSTPQSLVADESELQASLTGIDSTSSQAVHARYRYDAEDIRFGKRLVDMLIAKPDGRVLLDVSKFHDIEDASVAPPDTGHRTLDTN